MSDLAIDWAHSAFASSADPAGDAYDYILAVLSAPGYAERYWPELEAAAPLVPLTDDLALALDIAELGRRVRAAWQKQVATVGLKWQGQGHGPLGTAEFEGNSIRFASGRRITGVPPGVWSFAVSNYRVMPEWLAGRRHWTATIAQASETLKTIASVAALVDLEPDLDAAFDRLVGKGNLPTPLVSQVASRRRHAVEGDVDLARVTSGPIEFLDADVTIDIDCEHRDGLVYLWGATVRTPDEPQGRYRAFVDWTVPFDDSKEVTLAGEFVAWLLDLVEDAERKARSVTIYHYGSTEPANLRRVLLADTRLTKLDPLMVDLLAVLRDNFGGVGSKSLKTVGAIFGATWRTPYATGADTLGWVDEARGDGDDAVRARERLLAYNADDTAALQLLRKGLVGA